MKSIFKLITLLTLLLAYPCSTIAQTGKYGTMEYGKAINVSGKQRMLSQKISKDFLLMAKGINSMKIEKEFKSSKFIFERQLQILEKNGRTTTEKFSLKKIRKLWNEFKAITDGTPNYASAQKIMDLNTSLLKACHQLVGYIEENSKNTSQFGSSNDNELMKIINMSGKQRMLSQRYCLYHAASKMFPKDKDRYQVVLNQVYNEFDNAIGTLLINNYNTTAIEEEMGMVMAEWEKIQEFRTSMSLKDIFVSTNFLTTRFNLITGMYEGLSKNQ